MTGFSRFAFCVFASLALFCSMPLRAHQGHDHASPLQSPNSALSERAEARSDRYEIVAVARGSELRFFIDRFSTNDAVDDAQIRIETPLGSELLQAVNGEYRLNAPWVATSGVYDLIVTITENGLDEILPLRLTVRGENNPSLFLYALGLIPPISSENVTSIIVALALGVLTGAGATYIFYLRPFAKLVVLLFVLLPIPHHVLADSNSKQIANNFKVDRANRLPDGSLFVPKNVQRLLSIRTISVELKTHQRVIELPGKIIPDPDASGFVQASVGGRLSPPETGFPRLGARVRKGDILAYVDPPLQAIDLSDIRQRQGELDQQISIVERRLTRYEALAPSGAVARSQLEDTRSELQGLKERRISLDRSRRGPEELVAPVDGVIADGVPVAGQIATPNAVIFSIVDPTRLWVEARSFNALESFLEATARLSGSEVLKLSHRGSGLIDRSQSVAIHFAIDDIESSLRIGHLVTVFATTTSKVSGVALARSAIVRSTSGQDTVYIHSAAEKFEKRIVRSENLDAANALVSSGLAHGDRVVVKGAELLDQMAGG